jgi:hypothetical protein
MGVCAVCGRGSCVPSFHSFEEQEEAERRREDEDSSESNGLGPVTQGDHKNG